MEAELEKDQDDDVIKVPSENELDDDPELEALTKMAERHHEKMQQVYSFPKNLFLKFCRRDYDVTTTSLLCYCYIVITYL